MYIARHVRAVKVIVIGIGHGDLSPNSGREHLPFI